MAASDPVYEKLIMKSCDLEFMFFDFDLDEYQKNSVVLW